MYKTGCLRITNILPLTCYLIEKSLLKKVRKRMTIGRLSIRVRVSKNSMVGENLNIEVEVEVMVNIVNSD